jgi:hypothetical protein
MTSLDWGSVPTWVGTVFTSTSVLLAALSYRRSILDRERDQASKVSAWLSAPEHTDANFLRKDAQGRSYIVAPLPVVAHVANRSDHPIFDVDLKVKHRAWTLDELPPGRTATVSIPVEFRDHVPEGASLPTRSTIVYELDRPLLTFTDALGRRWRRSEDRRLERVRSEARTMTWEGPKTGLA